MVIMNTLFPIAAMLLHLVAGAPDQGGYRHFSLFSKKAASASNGVIEKTIDFTWDSWGDPTNWTQVVETGLILEYERMQGFISETHFDVVRFDTAVQEISRAFTGLMSLARARILSNDQVYRQFGYCISVFDEMVSATQILMTQEPLPTTSETLIANVIDLYIRLFSMYTIQATLDSHNGDLYESIQKFYDEFKSWRVEFWSLPDIPPEKRVLFQQYVKKCETKINDAMNQL